MTHTTFNKHATSDDRRLLYALAEELKLPLQHVKHQAELYEATHAISLQPIVASAMHAMLLVDNYLMVQTLRQQQLQLEPVSISSVLYESAHALTPLARQYDCTIELALDGKFMPVMSHQAGLLAAFTSIGTAFITAVRQPGQKVVLGAHKRDGVVVTGMYSATTGLGKQILRQGRALYGQAKQPLQSFTAHPAAGIFIADDIFTLLGAPLRSAQQNKQQGLAAALPLSHQLALL